MPSRGPDPTTVAAGLRVPAPLGDRLMLRALRESGGGAIAVSDDELTEAARAASGTRESTCPPRAGRRSLRRDTCAGRGHSGPNPGL